MYGLIVAADQFVKANNMSCSDDSAGLCWVPTRTDTSAYVELGRMPLNSRSTRALRSLTP